MKAYIYILLSLISIEINAQCIQNISSGNEHTLALKPDGTLWVWGNDWRGQIGQGGLNTGSVTPLLLSGATWSKVFASGTLSFAIKNDGTLWGTGEIGFGIPYNQYRPLTRYTLTQIGTDSDWEEIYPNWGGAIAKKTNGTLWGWGNCYFGNLNGYCSGGTGVSSTWIQNEYVQISTATDWSKIRIGIAHTLALKTNGTLWSCGRNDYGQLGDGTTTNRYGFIQVGTAADWIDLATSINCNHSLAIKSNGTLWGWGNNNAGNVLANIPSSTIPLQIGTDTNWAKIFTSSKDPYYPYYSNSFYTYAIKTDGTIWGATATGFIQIGADSDWADIFMGTTAELVFAKKTDNSLWQYKNLQMTQFDCSSLAAGNFNTKTITIYPNPTDGIVHLENDTNTKIEGIKMKDITGKTIFSTIQNFSEIDMRNFESGIYILSINFENEILNYKIIKK